MQTMPEVWPDVVQGIINTFQQTELTAFRSKYRNKQYYPILTTDNNKSALILIEILNFFSFAAHADLPNLT